MRIGGLAAKTYAEQHYQLQPSHDADFANSARTVLKASSYRLFECRVDTPFVLWGAVSLEFATTPIIPAAGKYMTDNRSKVVAVAAAADASNAPAGRSSHKAWCTLPRVSSQ
jgi:hypothetical protein